ncbi:hypothetical protein LRR80_05009 [Streptomyces sp. RO-S4]|nr:hypothetical protein [Streptomyces sp. RO-S4]
MKSSEAAVVTDPGADRTGHSHRLRRLVGTGFIDTLAP